MENGSSVGTSLVLLGIYEMEELKYLYSVFFLALYLSITILSLMIVFVILTEESLHGPMYILICNLTLNGIFGTSAFFPRLIYDLFSSSKTISYYGCITQMYCIVTFTYFEICTFTIMAYDRYLAVCHPLQYVILMTNEKTLKLILGTLATTLIAAFVAVLLTSRLPLCGTQIKNVFCDNMSIVILSCVDSTANNLYGTISATSFLLVTSLVIAYTYFRIFLVCINLSKDGHNKAFHVLVTHLLNFSIFLIGLLFSFLRYRLNSANLPLSLHVLLSITRFVYPPLLNPLIYGLRIKPLKIKIVYYLSKISMGRNI
ncbi:olfactory receptor 5F1-like [Spea bombifrons]|uniref:olfactory receptor 5F1-like n=1 Tax=Spea bombifrons TaxID=233779 RepID=UPI00234B75C7|nr:olfactory receptor 5F1-like [Spea bombifrons]